MQKTIPTNATGVPVSIDVLDSNGNFRNIGTATTDASGSFSLPWTPDIAGKYTVYASFVGSESYYPSNAETQMLISEAHATATPTTAPVQSMTDQYFLPAVIAIILVIVIVGAVIVLMLRKRP
jgi:hypothetical protein